MSKEINKEVKSSFWTALPWIAVILGIGLIITGSFHKSSGWGYAGFYIGQTMLVSGVFAVLLKSIQFLKIFKVELEKIIYSEEFLSVRNDLENLWSKVSSAIYKKKFPELSKHLNDAIMKEYLPTKQDFYYDDYRYSGEVKWFNKPCLMVECVEQIKINLIPSSQNKEVTYKFKYSAVRGHGPIETKIFLEKLIINGEDKLSDENGNIPLVLEHRFFKDEQGVECVEYFFETPLKGKEVYKINRVIKKRVSLELDPYARVAGKNFVLNSQVKVSSVADDIKVQFISLGTTKDYNDAGLHADFQDQSRCQVDKRFKGLLFPRQGFLLYYSLCKPKTPTEDKECGVNIEEE